MSRGGAPPLREALLLGALHGPAELLPISSSGHLTLVPWLLGWAPWQLEDDHRKSFEVALHVGTLAGLIAVSAADVRATLARRRLPLVGLMALPAAVAGHRLERPIERRLGTPGSIAAGLLAGSVAMAAAERVSPVAQRSARRARASDALALGMAQACALFPGVSRQGAVLAAARARGFARRDAQQLARQAGLPVLAGAGLLKAVRVAQTGLPAPVRGAFAAGMLASLASTAVCGRLVARGDGFAPAPWIAYRVALAAMVGARLRRDARAGAASAPGARLRRDGPPRPEGPVDTPQCPQ